MVVDGHAVRKVFRGHAPAVAAAVGGGGDLKNPFATAKSMREVSSMSAATVDRYLAPVRAHRLVTTPRNGSCTRWKSCSMGFVAGHFPYSIKAASDE